MTDLGQISLTLVTGAMVAYLVALIAFSVDLTSSSAALPARKQVKVASDGAPITEEEESATATPTTAASPSTSRRAARIGLSTFVLGTVLVAAGAVTRALAAGRVPWANMYEFTVMGVLIASLVFFGLQSTRDVRYLGTFVSGLSVVSLFMALAVLYTEPDMVQPALQSAWLAIHVSVAVAAMGVLAIAALFSALQLIKDRQELTGKPASGRIARVISSLPGSVELERISYRLNAVGFVLWTFTLIAGAIWAERAWGRYWGWDAKEVWTFVIWVIYAAYLHARATRGWEGRRAGWFSLIGFASILINYYVVNFFFSSLHSYAGV